MQLARCRAGKVIPDPLWDQMNDGEWWRLMRPYSTATMSLILHRLLTRIARQRQAAAVGLFYASGEDPALESLVYFTPKKWHWANWSSRRQ